MTTFPRSPRLLKGALVTAELGALPAVIAFQYNPATLTRSLEPQMMGAGSGAAPEAMRIKGAPNETITVEVEVDAADQLERGALGAVTSGVYPQLAALEMLVYPPSALVITNAALLAAGTIEVAPPMAPLTLFIWGPRRVLPVRVSSFSVTEESFDPNLSPTRAKVSLGLRVLSYNDLPLTHPGYHLFLAHQVVKESMAVAATGSSLAAVVGGNVRLPI